MFGHIIDPRTGAPAESAMLAAIVDPSATDGDALTTALLTEPALLDAVQQRRPQMKALVLSGGPTAPTATAKGIALLEAQNERI